MMVEGGDRDGDGEKGESKARERRENGDDDMFANSIPLLTFTNEA